MNNTIGSYTVNIEAKIKGYQQELQKIKQEIERVDPGSAIGKQLNRQFEAAQKRLNDLSKHSVQRIGSEANITRLTDAYDNMNHSIAQIGESLKKVQGQDLNFSGWSTEINSTTKQIDEAVANLSNTIDTQFNGTINKLLGGQSGKFRSLLDKFQIDPATLNYENWSETFAQALEKAKTRAQGLREELANLKKQRDSLRGSAQEINRDTSFNIDEVINKSLGKFSTQQLTEQFAPGRMGQIRNDVNKKLITSLGHILDENTIRTITNNTFNDLFKNITDPSQVSTAVNNVATTLAANLKDTLHNANPAMRSYNQGALKSSLGEELFGRLTDEASYLTNNEKAINSFANALQRLAQTYSNFNYDDAGANNVIEQAIRAFSQGNPAEAITTVTEALQHYKDVYNEIAAEKNKEADELNTQIVADQNDLREATSEQASIQRYSQMIESEMQSLNDTIQKQQQEIDDLRQQLEAYQTAQAGGAEDAAVGIRGAGQQTLNWTAGQQSEINRLTEEYLKQLDQVKAKQQLATKIEGLVQRWFSIYAVVRKVAQVYKEITNTLKTLDKTITEIAIVTDMGQAELWGQMATYTQIARQYGASIEGVYKVSQLYYQQGLETTDVMKLTNETLKMARISGLDYAKATDYMTNALRSFKMEMSEAQTIVDVYSAIAASSATNTKELAVAMSKTASSAEAVGSSFENTTAMMAVMIEDTREAPENIGSALKSIISRYGELKTDPTKLVDSEGEALSLNKVDTALQSVGISLHDVNGEFRDFDDVIME